MLRSAGREERDGAMLLLDVFDVVAAFSRALALQASCRLFKAALTLGWEGVSPGQIFVTLAIRISQSLGLHFPWTSSNQAHQQDRELIRRLWHGCVFVDRYVILCQTGGCAFVEFSLDWSQ